MWESDLVVLERPALFSLLGLSLQKWRKGSWDEILVTLPTLC